MLRDKNLVPLSHQHQHALALCVRIERGLARADATQLHGWQAEIEHQFATEIRYHFVAEEMPLFPAAGAIPQLQLLVGELMREHEMLRGLASQAAEGSLGTDGLLRFVNTLSSHIRKEERELFEKCQQLMTAAELERIGAAIAESFRSAGLDPNGNPPA